MTRCPCKPFPFPAALLLLSAVCLTGCEEDLTSRDRFEYPFAMYGVLSPDLNVQSILVFPVEDFPVTGHPAPLDAIVTSTDLVTGEVRTWMDSLSAGANGEIEHVYWSDFRAEYGHAYRIEVERPSDGSTSVAEARVPPLLTMDLADTDGTLLDVAIRGEAIRVLKPDVHYRLRIYDPEFETVTAEQVYTIPYQGGERKSDDGWEIRIRMLRDRGLLQKLIDKALNCQEIEPGFAFVAMTLSVIVGDAPWDPPGGVFDPDELGFPGVMDNVENGFGFVGGGYRMERRLRPTEESIRLSCFYYVPEYVWP